MANILSPALKLKPAIAAKAKERQGERTDLNIPQTFAESQTVAPQEQKKNELDRETNAQIAEQAGVSRETIRKVERIEQQATPAGLNFSVLFRRSFNRYIIVFVYTNK